MASTLLCKGIEDIHVIYDIPENLVLLSDVKGNVMILHLAKFHLHCFLSCHPDHAVCSDSANGGDTLLSFSSLLFLYCMTLHFQYLK